MVRWSSVHCNRVPKVPDENRFLTSILVIFYLFLSVFQVRGYLTEPVLCNSRNLQLIHVLLESLFPVVQDMS